MRLLDVLFVMSSTYQSKNKGQKTMRMVLDQVTNEKLSIKFKCIQICGNICICKRGMYVQLMEKIYFVQRVIHHAPVYIYEDSDSLADTLQTGHQFFNLNHWSMHSAW